MKNNKKSAFTLIELMVVIAIMWVLLMFSYAPYDLYQNKARLKLATREVSQSLYDAKQKATSGIEWTCERWWAVEKCNKTVVLVLDAENWKDWVINYYFVDFKDFENDDKTFKDTKVDDIWNQKPDEEKQLQQWVVFDGFWQTENDYTKIKIFYTAVTWEVNIFWYKNWLNREHITSSSSKNIKIFFSYKNSTSSSLKKTITYYIKTNIVDYEKN